MKKEEHKNLQTGYLFSRLSIFSPVCFSEKKDRAYSVQKYTPSLTLGKELSFCVETSLNVDWKPPTFDALRQNQDRNRIILFCNSVMQQLAVFVVPYHIRHWSNFLIWPLGTTSIILLIDQISKSVQNYTPRKTNASTQTSIKKLPAACYKLTANRKLTNHGETEKKTWQCLQ